MQTTTLSDPELLAFAARVLERHGGLIEPGADGLLALMPPALAQDLEVPEETRFGSEAAPLLYGSPLLDRLVGLARREVPVAYAQVEVPYLKKAGFEQLLARDLAFAGGQVRVSSRAQTRTTYMILWCHYVALSDERKEGLVHLGVHEAGGAVIPGLADLWRDSRPRFYPAGKLPPLFGAHLETALDGALKSARTLVAADLKGFLASMQRRLRRDVKNTREYYQALAREMEAGLAHPLLTEAQRLERQAKIDALPAEVARKIADLEQKYQVRVTISPAAAVRLLVEVVQLLLELRWHRLSRSLSAIWNPLTQSLDPLVCDQCRTTTSHLHPTVRDGDLRLLCHPCSQKAA